MQNKKGFSAIIIVVIVAVLAAIGGAIYFFAFKSSGTGAETSLDALNITTPAVDFSLSPIPKLNVSSLNVSAPDLPSSNIFPGFSVDSDFSYSQDVNFAIPDVQYTLPSYEAPSQSSDGQSSGQQGSESQGQPSIDCSAFSSAPSCSFVGAPGSTAYEACKQCYPAK